MNQKNLNFFREINILKNNTNHNNGLSKTKRQTLTSLKLKQWNKWHAATKMYDMTLQNQEINIFCKIFLNYTVGNGTNMQGICLLD